MRLRLTVAAAVMATLWPAVDGRGQERALYSSDAELVVLHVSVKDQRGAFVDGLSRDAFRVLENGRPQSIAVFSDQAAPVTIGLVIDGSGSMQPHRDLVIAAVRAFAEASQPQDELFALGFNETVHQALPDAAPFTNDPVVLSRALARSLDTRGLTALHDAIGAGLAYLRNGQQQRRVLVVLSDGADNASRLSSRDLLAQVRSSNTLVYAVGLIDAAARDANPNFLKQIARATGGELFTPASAHEMTDVLQRIAREIRNSYTIGYAPAGMPHDGTFHQLQVVVQPPDGQRLVVRTRTGYIAGFSKP